MSKHIKAIAFCFIILFCGQVWGAALVDKASIDLLKTSFKGNQNNTVISGLSVIFATDMLANGTTGESLRQLTSFMGGTVETKNTELKEKLNNLPATLEISNSMWGNDFKPAYKTKLESIFGAVAYPLPKHTDVINNWIKEKTHNKIPSVLEPEQISLENLYLVNTIYFKDDWIKPFDKEDTKLEIFHSITGQDVKMPMMHDTATVLYAENNKLQSIQLRYKNGGAMIIYLPKDVPHLKKTHSDLDFILNQRHLKAKETHFKDFISNLSAEDLNLVYKPQRVVLTIPKFKIDTRTNVRNLFEALGIKGVFYNSKDLENIAPNARVRKIQQRAMIEVDEFGTTAAAATVVAVKSMSVDRNVYHFTVNRPFLFFVTQGNFIGVYTKP